MQTRIERLVSVVSTAVLAIACAFILCAVMLLVQGISPTETFQCILYGAAGSSLNLLSSISAAVPLATAALGVTIAYRAGVYNIGVEGQIFVGAMFATLVGTQSIGLPMPIHLLLSLLAGMLGGAFWALLPAVMKVRKGFNEVITTVLLNYIGIYLVSYAVSGPLRQEGSYVNQSAPIVETSILPKLVKGSDFNAGIFLLAVALVVVTILLKKSDWGYEIDIVGKNPLAAQTFGIEPGRTTITVMLLSGALAGLAGTIEVLGNQGVLAENFAVNMGYNSISVALLGGLSGPGCLLAALFMGGLRNGGIMMQISMGISSTLINMLQAILILTVLTFTTVKIVLPIVRKRRVGHA